MSDINSMDDRIRSRRPLRSGHSGSHSPCHGSPIRRNGRHLSPNLSGSDDEGVDQDLVEYESHSDLNLSSNSTLNSSADVADGSKYTFKRTEGCAKYYPDGMLKEVNITKIEKVIARPKKVESPNRGWLWILIMAIVGIIAVGFAFYQKSDFVNNNGVADEQRIRCSFEQSELQFPKQDKILWRSLQSGVEDVLNRLPTAPSIFLLAYEDGYSANRITRSIVARATECMDSRVNALELSPADLDSSEMKSDYGVVITKYGNQLKRSGVMLVNDLNKIPTEVVPAFHSFCDVHNPLVDRSIIFLTLQLTREIHSSSYANTLALVEHYLRSNWSELNNFVLDPLIVRVTEQVFLLNKE